MNEQEIDFWQWWESAEPYKDQITLRMAFDAGYQAARGEQNV